jgi:hypothetical protein
VSTISVQVEEERQPRRNLPQVPEEESMDALVRVAHAHSGPVNAASGFPHLPLEPAEPPVDSVDKNPVSLAPPLPGDFLLAEYESDCARFVADARNLARRRMNRPLLAQ